MIKQNKITHASNLWVAQGSLMDIAGIGGSGGDRDGAVWFEIGNLASSPAILQSASLCDTSGTGTSIVHYTYPSIAESGQGHNIMGFTSVGASKYAQAGVAGRYLTQCPEFLMPRLILPILLRHTTLLQTGGEILHR